MPDAGARPRIKACARRASQLSCMHEPPLLVAVMLQSLQRRKGLRFAPPEGSSRRGYVLE